VAGPHSKARLLSPHELNLRRATQPLGFAAVLAWGVWVLGARTLRDLLAPELHNPVANWLPLALLGTLLLFGFAVFTVGLRGCWGVRSDGLLPVTALARLALGGGGLALLMSGSVPRRTCGLPQAGYCSPLWRSGALQSEPHGSSY
jgi:hypothetical protein